MKKRVFTLLLFLAASAIGYCVATTGSVGYQAIRSQVATADHDPNSVERTYAYYMANLTGKVYVPRRDDLSKLTYANYIDLVFTFNDADATAVVTIYAMRDPDGVISPLEPVCAYTLAAGAQQTGEATARYFADQGTLVSNPWDVTILDYDGSDGVFKITFDSRGYWGFIILFTTLSDDDNVSSYGAYY